MRSLGWKINYFGCISYHFNGDDTRLHVSMNLNEYSDLGTLPNLMAALKNWMSHYVLQMNSDESEFLII